MLTNGKTFVVCELAQTHEGNFELARLLIKAVAATKADAIKFHVFQADELAVPDYKYFDLFCRLQWTRSQWQELIDLAHQLGLKFFADVLGVDSARMLREIGVDGIKIHATDIRNKPLLKEFATYDIPLLLSFGGALLEELKEAVVILEQHKKSRPLVLMHGFQNYPTLIEHTNLFKMKSFGSSLGLPYGFADHIDGDHAQNFSLCAMAVGMGASVIEKHITISRLLKMEDYESALDPLAFADFVEKMRQLDLAKGEGVDKLLPVELEYRKTTRKHVVTLTPILKGTVIHEGLVALKRAPSQGDPMDLEDVLGKKVNRDLGVHDVILKQDIMVA